jgi:lipopolysaccharide export system protein LptC
MQAKRLLLVAVAAALLLCAAGWTGSAQRQTSPTSWEYKSTPASYYGRPDDRLLNELGAQGWELIGVNQDGSVTYYFFKRPK